MKHLKYFSFTAVCLFGMGCQSQKQIPGRIGNTNANAGAVNLEATLSLAAISVSRERGKKGRYRSY